MQIFTLALFPVSRAKLFLIGFNSVAKSQIVQMMMDAWAVNDDWWTKNKLCKREWSESRFSNWWSSAVNCGASYFQEPEPFNSQNPSSMKMKNKIQLKFFMKAIFLCQKIVATWKLGFGRQWKSFSTRQNRNYISACKSSQFNLANSRIVNVIAGCSKGQCFILKRNQPIC